MNNLPPEKLKTRVIMIDGVPGDEPLIKIDLVAELLCVSVITVRKKVMLRQIPFYKIGGAVRFRWSEIRAWLDEQFREVVQEEKNLNAIEMEPPPDVFWDGSRLVVTGHDDRYDAHLPADDDKEEEEQWKYRKNS